MAKLSVGLPSAQFILNILIAIAILAFALRMLPENYRAWFRW